MTKKYKLKIEYAIIGFIISALVYLFDLLGVLNPVAGFMRGVTGGFQEYLYKTGIEISQSFSAITKVNILSSQTDNLIAENNELRGVITDLEAQKASLEKRLAQNIKYPNKQYIYARVRNISNTMSEIIVGAGSDQGVAIGDVVVVSNIPVGQVKEVGYQYCKVKLITSNEIRLPIKFADSKMNGFLEYDDTKGFIIRNLPPSYNYARGEYIVSTGVNSAYYNGLFLGSVDSVVGNQTDPSRTVKVTYPITLNELEEVFIVLNSSIEIK